MKRILLAIVWVLHGVIVAGAAEQAPFAGVVASGAWPHERSDIPPDARVTWGRLENGLRYAILPTQTAPTRGSLRMLVFAGSAMEADDQQGLAHFLEHMAFNGTKNFPAGETFEYFQRLGMAFGAHTNATTSVDYTTYKLELPRANEQLTTDGLRLFRDFLDGMLLDEREIERERGVVLSEQTARNTAAYRAAIGTLQAALAGTKAADRMPLGTVESIRSFRRERLVDFYETWYTPGRTVIVAVGDFNAAQVEAEIRRQFADARAKHGETPDPQLGRPTADRGLTARFTSVPDASTATVCLSCVAPVAESVKNMARQREVIVEMLVERMMSKRFEVLTGADDAVLQAASFGDERLFNVVRRQYLAANCRPARWAEAVGMLRRELDQALAEGFDEVELAEAKSALASLFDMVLAQAETQQPDSLADEIVESLTERNVFAHPTIFRKLIAEEVPQLTVDECRERLNALWEVDNREVAVSGNVELKTDDGAAIVNAYRGAAAPQAHARTVGGATRFAYADFGPAGSVVEREEHADLGVVQARFANGVRVNIKPTTFAKNEVRVAFRFGGGLLEMPADKPGLQLFAQAAFIAGGLRDLTLTELNREIGGKNIGVSFAVGDDAFQLGGDCSTSSLDLQLQVCTAYLTAPAFRADTERQFREVMESLYAQRAHTPEGVLRFDGGAMLRSNDPRFVLPTPDEAARLSLADVAAWLARPLSEGYLEVTLVGDVEVDPALELLAKTVGALPQRAATKPDFAAARNLKFPAPQAQTLSFDSAAPRATAAVFWPVAGAADIATCRRLTVLKQVLSDRLRREVREELGAVYTPSVYYSVADAYPDFGFFGTELTVDPQDVERIAATAANVAAELATGSISDDEFERAVQPLVADIEVQRRDNGYWLGAIADSQERPAALDEIRSKASAYASITKAEVERLAKQYLSADKTVRLSVAPQTTPTQTTSVR